MTGRFASSLEVLLAATVGQAFGVVAVTMASFGVFVGPLAAEFGWRRGDISLAISIFNVSTVFMLPVGGWLIDRFGARRVLMPSILLFGLTLASLSRLSGPIWLLYVGYALLPVLGIGTQAIAYSRLIVGWFSAKRGLALGTSLSGMGLSVALLPLLAQTITSHSSWRSAYLVLGTLAIAVPLPLIALWARDPLPAAAGDSGLQAAAGKSPHGSAADFHRAIRSKSYLLLTIAFALLGLLTGAVPSHLVPLLVERGVDAMRAAVLASALGFSLIAGRFVTGYLMDRVFAPLLLVVVIIIAVAGLGMMLANVSGAGMVAAISFMGFAMGSDTDLLAYMVSRYMGLRAFTRIYGLVLAAFGVGNSTGPFLMGFSSNAYNSYNPALVGLIGATLVAIIPILLLGRYRDETDARGEAQVVAPETASPHL